MPYQRCWSARPCVRFIDIGCMFWQIEPADHQVLICSFATDLKLTMLAIMSNKMMLAIMANKMILANM